MSLAEEMNTLAKGFDPNLPITKAVDRILLIIKDEAAKGRYHLVIYKNFVDVEPESLNEVFKRLIIQGFDVIRHKSNFGPIATINWAQV